MIRFLGRVGRSAWYGCWILAILIGVPWALTRFVGWPLPQTMPDAQLVADWLEHPLEPHRAIKLLAILIWLAWAGFVVVLAVETYAAARRVRAPRIRLATPLQGIAASLVGATATALAGGTAHAAPPAAPADAAVATVPDLANIPTARAQAPVYVVEPGDWLGAIAERFLGDADAYPRIQHLNPDLENRDPRFPDHIEPGWRLRLPVDAHDRGARRHATGHAVNLATHTDAERSEAEPPVAVPVEPPVTVPSEPSAGHPESEPASGDVAAPSAGSGSSVDDTGDETDGVVHHVGPLAGAGLLASLLLAMVTAERRRQRPFFPAGHPLPLPRSGRAERELRAAQQPEDVKRLDAALRDLGQRLAGRDSLPDIVGVRLVGRDVHILLAEPDDNPPEPWLDEGTQWALPGYIEPPDTDHPPTLLPQLVTIGSRAGRHLHLDLERLATLSIAGHPATVHDLLRHIVCEISTATWMEHTSVILVGFGDETDALIDINPKRIDAVATTADAVAITRSELRQRAAGAPSDPAVFAFKTTTGTDRTILEQIHKEILAAGRCGLAVVAVVPDGTPIGDALLTAAENGQLRVDVPGLRLTTDAASLPADLLDPIADLLRVARLNDLDVAAGLDGSLPGDILDHARGVLNLFDPAALIPEAPGDRGNGHRVATVDLRPAVGPAPPTVDDSALDADLAAWHAADPSRPRIAILGPVQSYMPGELVDSRHRLYLELLLFLLTRPHQAADRDQIEDALWYGNPAGEGSIRVAIARTRKWLGPRPDGGDWISGGHGPDTAYRLADGILLDWHLLVRLRDRAHRRGDAGITDYRAALELVRSVPLRGTPDRGKYRRPYMWIGDSDIAPLRIIDTITDIAHRLATHSLDHGDTTAARWAVDQAWLADPDRGVDDLWHDRMHADHLDGRTAALRRLVSDLQATREAEVLEDLPPRTYNLIRSLLPDAA